MMAALFAGTFGVSQVAHPVAVPAIALDSIPIGLGGLSGRPAPPLAPDVQRVLGADQYLHRYYEAPGAAGVEMDVAYYGRPHVGATAHSPLNCLPGNGWAMSEPQASDVRSANGAWTVREVTVARGSDRWGMAYWFQGRDRVDYNEFAARWHLFTDALWRRPADTTMVRVMTPLTDAAANGHATLVAFAGALIPQVDAALTTAR